MENKELFSRYIKIFLEENSKVNLISKNDEKLLWEKHICDSLAIKYFFKKYKDDYKTLLDIGTGGGFPAIPIACVYNNLQVTAIDSISKKIRAVETISQKLELKNIKTICERVENINEKFDIVTSRAVSDLKKICTYALPKLNINGYFIAYKSKKALEEIKEAKATINKYDAQIIDIIDYTLPLKNTHTRNLIIIKNNL